MFGKITTFFILAAASLIPPQAALASDFGNWLYHFKQKATAQGVTSATLATAFDGVEPDSRVVKLDGKQPERTKTGFSDYLRRVLSQERIDTGRQRLSENSSLVSSASQAYGVPPEMIISLWGIETSYGRNTGGYDLIRSLATLAWEGRRRGFFEKELIEALKIIQGGHIQRDKFIGSWAGAMGQNQFMPSSWNRYAVDFDKDGRRDIWGTRADVFGSTANYLHQNGWNPALKWGWTLTGAEGLSRFAKETRPYQDWLSMGVRFKDSAPPSIAANTPLTLIVPDGGDGRAYLVSNNYNVILSWNRSTYFALTVGILSDLVAKGVHPQSLGYNN